MTNLLPQDPSPGMIVEIVPGVFFQYDSGVRSWVEMTATDLRSDLATSFRDGLMDSADLHKLNRLVLPPPQSTITAESCNTVFGAGNLAMRSLDDLVRVQGSRELLYRDADGAPIGRDFPFQIHQHTFGFDFGLSLDELVNELRNRGQVNVQGPRGKKGKKGKRGPKGIQQVLTGPAGDRGDPGDAPPCGLSISKEIYPAQALQDLKRVIVGLVLEPNATDPDKYTIVAQRQVVGIPDASAGVLRVSGDQSPWVLALASATGPQQVYYLDMDPLVETIHQKFLSEVRRLKTGFEAVVLMWLQRMSDLFDEQKLALCCALEFCESRKSNTEGRRHIEMASAVSVGKGKAKVQDRDGPQSIEFKVAPDCAPSGFPDLGGGTASNTGGDGGEDVKGSCADCWLSGPAAPAVVTIIDKFGAVTLTKDGQTYLGCALVPSRLLPAICNANSLGADAGEQKVPILYEVGCGVIAGTPPKEFVVLRMFYPGCPTATDGPPAAGQSCPAPGVRPAWVNQVSAMQSAAQIPYTSCADDVYTFAVKAPAVYGSQNQVVTVRKGAVAAPPPPTGPPVPPPPVNFPGADAERCLFGPDTPSPPSTLVISDPKFGEITLVRGTSATLRKNVWTACKAVQVPGIQGNPNTGCNGALILGRIILRYDLYVAATSQGHKYALRISYPSCAGNVTRPGIPAAFSSAPGGALVECDTIDSGNVPNIWSGTGYVDFATCARPLDLNFSVDLPYIYGPGSVVGIQDAPSFRVREYPPPPPAPPVVTAGCADCLHAAQGGLPAPAKFYLDDGGPKWITMSLQEDGKFAGYRTVNAQATVDCVNLLPNPVPVIYTWGCDGQDNYVLTSMYPACKQPANNSRPTIKAEDGVLLDGDNLYTKWPRVISYPMTLHASCRRPFSADLNDVRGILYPTSGTGGMLFLRESLPAGAAATPAFTMPQPPPPPPPSANNSPNCEYCLHPPFGWQGKAIAVKYSDSKGKLAVLKLVYDSITVGYGTIFNGKDEADGDILLGCALKDGGTPIARSVYSLQAYGGYVEQEYRGCFPADNSGLKFNLPDRVATLTAYYPLPLPAVDPSAACPACLIRDGFSLYTSSYESGIRRMHRFGDRWISCSSVAYVHRLITGLEVTVQVPVLHYLSCVTDPVSGRQVAQLRTIYPVSGPPGTPGNDVPTNLDYKFYDENFQHPPLTCSSMDDTKYVKTILSNLPLNGCRQPLVLNFSAGIAGTVTVTQIGADPIPGLDSGSTNLPVNPSPCVTCLLTDKLQFQDAYSVVTLERIDGGKFIAMRNVTLDSGKFCLGGVGQNITSKHVLSTRITLECVEPATGPKLMRLTVLYPICTDGSPTNAAGEWWKGATATIRTLQADIPFDACGRPWAADKVLRLSDQWLYGGSTEVILRELPPPAPAIPYPVVPWQEQYNSTCAGCLNSAPATMYITDLWGTVPFTRASPGVFRACKMVTTLGTDNCDSFAQVQVPVSYELTCLPVVGDGLGIYSTYQLKMSYPTCKTPTIPPTAVPSQLLKHGLTPRGGQVCGGNWADGVTMVAQSWVNCSNTKRVYTGDFWAPELTGHPGTFRVQVTQEQPTVHKLSLEMPAPSGDQLMVLDAVRNSGGAAQAVEITLPPGTYLVSIVRCCPQIGGEHQAPVRLTTRRGGGDAQYRFLDKGKHGDAAVARGAYEGLSLRVEHDGGAVRAWLSSLTADWASGSITLRFTPEEALTRPDRTSCRMDVSKLAWYEKGWQQGRCCGAVVTVDGQDWIVMKRSVGADMSCGGGDMAASPCNQKFGSPAYAWPTFDGHEFAGMPTSGTVQFQHDQELSRAVGRALAAGEYAGRKGDLGGLGLVLFPMEG